MEAATMKDRLQKIRTLIENAKPADEYIAECGYPAKEKSDNNYQKHLDALIAEHDALLGDEYMNKREAVSIRALVAYTAYHHNIGEDVTCAIVEELFGLEEIRKLPRQKYQEVINYLVDFDPKRIMN
ncbi:MAG: hypothetical protein RBT70_04710 [Alphaproteobacteria bacterium]|jgi:hypothetical protein|nr:hypothetical protein [Alphaproteobacteria bacterium]